MFFKNFDTDKYDTVYKSSLTEEEMEALREKARSTGRIQRVVNPGAVLAWLVIFPGGGMRQAYSA